MEEIRSKDNPLVKALVKLSGSRKQRREENRFLLEGARLCSDAVRSGFRPQIALITEEAMEKYPQASEVAQAADRVIMISKDISQKLSETAAPQGVFCVCEMKTQMPQLSPEGRYLVLSSLQDPGNVGTILRTAEALGLDGVLATADCPDFYSPKVLRSAMGSVLRIPFLLFSTGEEAVEALHEKGIRVYAAALTDTAVPITEVELGNGCAMVIGNEGSGLTESVIRCCDQAAIIPMAGNAESLNAATAAALCIWEMVRRG